MRHDGKTNMQVVAHANGSKNDKMLPTNIWKNTQNSVPMALSNAAVEMFFNGGVSCHIIHCAFNKLHSNNNATK